MLDTTASAREITLRHSPSCELSKYVDMHGGIEGLQIEDVQSLMSADRAVFPEKVPVLANEPASITKTPITSAANVPLHMVTEPYPSSAMTYPNNTSTVHEVTAPHAPPANDYTW